MARIYLDCCKDDETATAAEAYRNADGHTVLGRVVNVDEIRRYLMELKDDGSGNKIPVETDARKYYPDGHNKTAPPKIFVVSSD